MRQLVVVTVLLLAVIAAVGFYRGWFRLSTDNTGQTPSATITVDKGQIRDDEQSAKEKVQGFGHEAQGQPGERADKVKEQDPAPETR